MAWDDKKLKHWVAVLESGEAMLAPLTDGMARVSLELIDQGFESETDPYGDPWAPKQKPDGRKVLQGETGRLRRYTAVPYGKHRFVLLPGAEYATAHQAPRSGRTRRMMVPTAALDLPESWSAALSREAINAMRTHFKFEGQIGHLGIIKRRGG